MNAPVFLDHIEIHVDDIPRYCDFLTKLFRGGRYKVISETGTSMFQSNDGVNFEIKKKKTPGAPILAGVCQPCLRMENAKPFIENDLKLKIEKEVLNPDGSCYFFFDHEGVSWHVKDYLIRDKYINW